MPDAFVAQRSEEFIGAQANLHIIQLSKFGRQFKLNNRCTCLAEALGTLQQRLLHRRRGFTPPRRTAQADARRLATLEGLRTYWKPRQQRREHAGIGDGARQHADGIERFREKLHAGAID